MKVSTRTTATTSGVEAVATIDAVAALITAAVAVVLDMKSPIKITLIVYQEKGEIVQLYLSMPIFTYKKPPRSPEAAFITRLRVNLV